MAGESSRFNYKFKPFLYLDNKRFIEHCIDSFLPYNSIINTFTFIITQQQEEDYKVINTIQNIFYNIKDKLNIIQIEKKTRGPYQTILVALKHLPDYKNIIICDCDHHINIKPIIEKINNKFSDDIIIPVWDIEYEEQYRWGKIVINKLTNEIVKICEKEIVEYDDNMDIFGMIGCYYFKSTQILCKNLECNNMSDFFKTSKHKLTTIKIKDAYFFGDPLMVEETIKKRRHQESVFCDVDGVLLKHKPNSNDNIEDNIILGNCVETINKWKEENKKIIICTSRPKNTIQTFSELLRKININYDELIMGLNPGPRYIINDIKPTNIFVKQAREVNLIRDEGINDIKLNESNKYNIEIIKMFKGNSACKTYLLKEGSHKFVRKYIIKKKNTYEHYEKLNRQCDDLKRFKYYDNTLVPNILRENDSNFDYYFDLEYFENNKQLDTYNEDIQFNILNIVVEKLIRNVYCYKKEIDNNFMEKFMNNKIYPKLQQFEKECDIMNYLINSKCIKINNYNYKGLRYVLESIDINNYMGKYVHPIHGDLTLENILYDKDENNIKLIDMDGSRYVDSCLLDLGKIFQSIVSKYKEWNVIDNVIFDEDINNLTCLDNYFHEKQNKFLKYKNICDIFNSLLNNDNWYKTFKQGIFYMATYFIRFVQFRRQINNQHGIFAIIMAINWLNFISESGDILVV